MNAGDGTGRHTFEIEAEWPTTLDTIAVDDWAGPDTPTRCAGCRCADCAADNDDPLHYNLRRDVWVCDECADREIDAHRVTS
jgi:hypothetical protein